MKKYVMIGELRGKDIFFRWDEYFYVKEWDLWLVDKFMFIIFCK